MNAGTSMDFSSLLSNIRRHIEFPEAEESLLTSIIKVTHVRKRQMIDQPGFVSGHRNYVAKGAFRSFFVDKEGKEHTLQIAIEDWFISDFYSYITRTPATLYAEALEDSVLFQLTYDEIEALCARHHGICNYFRITTEHAFANSRKRLLSNFSLSAEERYHEFTNRYPGINRRVPQKVIASYLGISPEFLSKIRSRHQ